MGGRGANYYRVRDVKDGHPGELEDESSTEPEGAWDPNPQNRLVPNFNTLAVDNEVLVLEQKDLTASIKSPMFSAHPNEVYAILERGGKEVKSIIVF